VFLKSGGMMSDINTVNWRYREMLLRLQGVDQLMIEIERDKFFKGEKKDEESEENKV
jgi:hypothetical protein